MAYTFGTNTTDDISWTSSVSVGANSSACLVMGWWYPTTLTATRGLWSSGTVFGAEVDTTTSEVRLRTDNTTDGQWTTTGAGLTTNTWTFLAFMNSCNNTGPAAAWRVWAGTGETPPVELTVTQATAPVGNFTGSTAFCTGNKGNAGTLAWQGDIDNLIFVATGATAGATTHPLYVATNGTITNDEALLAYQNFVLPFWRDGFLSPDLRRGQSWGADHVPYLTQGSAQITVRRWVGNNANDVALAATPNGATSSQNRCPRVGYPMAVNGYLPDYWS